MAKANTQIKKGKIEIQIVMQSNLAFIAESIIDQVMKNAKKLPDAKILDSIKNITPKGLNGYKSDLKAAMAVVSSMALDQARTEVPKASKVKLMESEERLLFGEFERLPSDIRKRINASNQLLVGTQIADLEKNIFFQFNSSVASGKPLNEVEFDMNNNAEKYVMGNAVQAGAGVVSANIVNEARNAFFFDKKVLEEIDAFQFMNATPVAAVCIDLSRGGGNGIIFAKDDPNAFRYTPPLHYNCTSWIRPILNLNKNQKIEKFKPSTQKIEDTIQFSHSCHDIS